jgi:hypothetical protein
VVHSLLFVSVLALAQSDTKSGDVPAEKATPAAPAKNAELEAKVKALVRQLDSDQQSKREAAEKELIALGEEVLPLLPAITSKTPAEVKNRLGRVRKALMDAAIAATTRPKFVTLAGEMLLSEALAAVEKQTGNRIVDSREEDKSDPKVKLELNNAPFWEALDTILDAAGLTLYNYDSEQGSLSYIARQGDSLARIGRGSYSGIFPPGADQDRNRRQPSQPGRQVAAADRRCRLGAAGAAGGDHAPAGGFQGG